MAVKESGMFRIQQTVGTFLCCKCGILMAPNAANTCVKCLRSEVNIIEGLQKNVIIMYCSECNSYLQPPRSWIKCELESKELLTFCVKRLKNLNKVRLVHAEFIWTEPHSKRIKVKVRVQKQVLNGVVLEQAYLVEYVVQDHLCESCSRVAANPDQWIASVQLRQNVPHRRTFFYLEQLILKHDAALRAIKIKQMNHGIDLFFSNRSHALKFVDFVGKVCPIKSRNDKQQAYLVEYVVQDHLCESCSRVAANPDQWIASVQLRQHVPHRRTFFYLEQLILKHDAALRAIKIKQMDHGIDLFFSNRSHALKFVDFVGKVCPIKSRNDKRLVSHDEKSSTYNYKYTFSVEICPICREDLIILPPKTARSLGNLGPLVLCTKVSDSIALLDPLTLRMSYMVADQYWKTPFKTLLSSRQLVEYIVLDVESMISEVNVGGTTYTLADVQVARVSDFGKNDLIFNIRTHVGHLLNPGDYALGYDLYGANCNDIEIDKYKGLIIPDAILIKKSYEEERLKKRPRAWKLKSMNDELDNSNRKLDQEKMDTEYEESLYRNKEYQPSEMTDADDDGQFPLDQMLAGLELGDKEEDDNNNGQGMSD
ncbi:hypothetical protein MKW92_047243 [Papaver armeniacum]|nr:hypothetical protein MKW92_047243 [Papaver armeniacum]